MFGFGKKAGPTVGLDINGQTISIIQLEKTKTDLKISRFASIMTPPDLVREGLLADPEQAGQVVKELLTSAGVTGKTAPTVHAVIPGQAVVIRLMPVPKGMPPEELNEVVRQEAINNLPFPIDEANLDWKKVPGTARTDPDGVEREDVLLGAIQRTVAEGYQRMAESAGFTLGRLEISSLSAIRALAFAGMLGRDNTLTLLVNMRYDATDITLISKGVPLFSRSVLLGVETVLEAISRSINCSQDEAMGLVPKVQLLGVPTVEPRLGQAAQVTRSVCSDLTAEVGRSLEFYMSQVGMVRVDQVIVSGPGTIIPEVDQFIANRLNLKTLLANPFAGLVYDHAQILDERRAHHTVLVGLLTDPDGAATKTVSIDLNKEVATGGGAVAAEEEGEEGEVEEIDTPWFVPALVAGGVLAGIVLIGWLAIAMFIIPGKEQEIAGLDEAISQAKTRLDNLNKAEDSVKQLEARKAALEAIVKHGTPVSTVLDTVKSNTPKGVQVSQMKIDGASCAISGNAADFSKVSHLAINLQGSNVFSSAEIGSIKRPKEHPRQINFNLASTIAPNVNTSVVEEVPEEEVIVAESLGEGVTVPGTPGRMKVLDFYADWAPPCQRMKPIMEEARKRYKNIEFVTVNIDDPKNDGLKRQFDVQSVPHLYFLDGQGTPVEHIRGFTGEAESIYKACAKLSNVASKSSSK